MPTELILGAGYVGAALASRALDEGREVVLADNWHATDREQLSGLERRGARVEDADIREPSDLRRLLSPAPDRVHLLAAQASRPLSEREPDYTEQTNLTGARRVAEAVAESAVGSLVYASSLHVYGPVRGEIGPDCPYGPQGDLAHLSKVYAELCLRMYAERGGFGLSVLRLGIVYGPSPVMHERPESQTVIDKFRALAGAGEPLPLDDGGTATIGAVHVEDVAEIMLGLAKEPGVSIENVAAETLTVADVAALAEGRSAGGEPACSYASPFPYRRDVAEYLGDRSAQR